MKLALLPWIILFLPLGAAGVITLFTQRNRQVSATLSVGAVVVGFILSVIFVKMVGWQPATSEVAVNWLSVGPLQVDFGLHFDPMSLAMMLMVTGVASLIHIYSMGYMHDDESYSRFFACLSLFTFSMLGIVLANNFLQLFIFWELVGVSSYLLIGFWYGKASAADAAKKAFITNRLGDFGFILGILTIWATLHSLNIVALHDALKADPQALGTVATVAGLLIFCGAAGKSAQFPLHVWLPDAMEGPTPVSALIHAATMVAAGVYMLCRVFFIFTPDALQVIAWIGGFTSLLAALIAVQQNDIKRILAYSTLSQLGYMVMAVGLNGPPAAMFHLTTHAFFKALLFLGAGSVILGMHHEQDIWNMGALRKKMPATFWTFMVGTLALAGLWPFSGFFSKDSILGQAFGQHNYILFGIGVFVAMLTSFYMFRLVFVVFYGKAKTDAAGHAHESPGVMVWPLRILAIASILAGGFVGVEEIYLKQFPSETTEQAASFAHHLFAPFIAAPAAAFLGLGALALGFIGAYALYANTDKDPLPETLGALSRAMRNRFYFDEIYEATVIRLHNMLAAIAGGVDWCIENVFIGFVRGGTDFSGRALRLLQNGNLQTYTFLFALGVALVLYLVLGK
ncbi:MAG TPA: NADH-quinone oxidoreductase subunit L [Verrucomicrobiae bacterium]|nr:NADH-quinone oxidoreductase subunit L [Verrucomicrobiae bacterium]